ncbi:hypothetical protein [Escherichia coli]|uniref:hypothetical protein n=1 Tax=Escherichia coli TaxID=562 RepID=UPI000BE1AC2E|nr:hypothetical protein [Escherichia coli]
MSIKNDGHYFCRAGGNRPDGLNEPVTKMVDSKLSDNKKKMLVLQHYGYTQSQIGKKLLSRKQQPMTPQAVSKALAAVRKDFLLPANRPGKSQQKF